MSMILCPTRGGQSSIPNQEWAISLAKEQGANLTFLYISNVRFLNRFSSPLIVDFSDKLDEMGEFLLAMAQDRAAQAGIEADTIVRQGDFQEALTAVIQEINANAVVIGQAARGTGITDESYMTVLAHAVKNTGAELFIVDEGQVVHLHSPTPESQPDETESVQNEA
ncbi:MAG: universal stress protein [Chloroflexi bacterium]|nr:universal stress protein [Chloroflexota bacterium]